MPLIKGGVVEFDLGGEKKTVRINRIHLEEDAGKLIHEGNKTFIDLNRCGVPLIATTHAGSIAELMGRPGIRLLHDTGAFGAYVGIRRRTDRFDYIYSVTPWENALGSR